jgi:two-component system sensor histidine kinase YesM
MIYLYYSVNDAEKKAIYSLQGITAQAVMNLEYKINTIKNMMNLFASNEIIQSLIEKNISYYEENIGNWVLDANKYINLLYNLNNDPDIFNVHLYMEDGLAALKETDSFILIDNHIEKEWFRSLVTDSSSAKWFPSDYFDYAEKYNDYLYYIRKIPNRQNLMKISGLLRADINIYSIKKILNRALYTENTVALIINSNDEFICFSGEGSQVNPQTASLFSNSMRYANMRNGFEISNINNRNFITGITDISKTDWKLVIIVPYNDIIKSNIKIRNRILLLYLFIIPVIIPFSFWIANFSTKRIRNLILHLRNIEHGKFDVQLESDSNDEIGVLIKKFNYTLSKIAVLMDEKYELGKEANIMELKALQAQINPHFLYNTLELINCMAIKRGTYEICQLVTSISRFYRLSLSKGEDFVTIENELEHVKLYIGIQNMRFNNNISLEIQVPVELNKYRILKMVLQPFVENSVLHGIAEKDSETGTIRISGDITDDTISIDICDNGVGMSDDILIGLISDNNTADSSGYGIHNVYKRLKLNFGDKSSISIKSEMGVGTMVSIKFPVIK